MYFRKTDRSSESIPLDITGEVLVGLLLAMMAVLNIGERKHPRPSPIRNVFNISNTNLAGGFKEIRASVQLSQKSWENAKNRPSFYVFNHRGR